MTPAQHYAEAERLMHLNDNLDVPVAQGMAVFAVAQIHATLALVPVATPTQADADSAPAETEGDPL